MVRMGNPARHPATRPVRVMRVKNRRATAEPGPWEMRLNKIYLLRSYQRQRLGRAMMRVIVRRLLANGKRSMALFTETDNEPACAF